MLGQLIKKKRTYVVFLPLLALAIALFIDSRTTGLVILTSALKVIDGKPVEKNVAYGEEDWRKLDVYPQSTVSPVVIFVHGGGWHSGNKDLYYFAADAFYRLGYTVVVPDYLKYPEGRFPTFVEDIAKTVAWVKANIQSYQGDPERIFLSGHSAGAHSGALVVSDARYLAAEGLAPSVIKGFAGIAGPYQFTPKWPQYIETFGEQYFQQMKAGNHINGSEPPIMLIHATGDSAVGLFNYQDLLATLNNNGVHAEGLLYGDDINHISIVTKLHPWFADTVHVAKDIDNFFNAL